MFVCLAYPQRGYREVAKAAKKSTKWITLFFLASWRLGGESFAI